MPNDETDGALHLPDLRIRNFRGIREIDIPRLGRVTLITGKNSVGKTTILEACRVYAERGRLSVLYDLSLKHDEYNIQRDIGGDKTVSPDLSCFFHRGDISQFPKMDIGPKNHARLKIEVNPPKEEYVESIRRYFSGNWNESDTVVMEISYNEYVEQHLLMIYRDAAKIYGNRPQYYLARGNLQYPFKEYNTDRFTNCVHLGPEIIGDGEMARFLDGVALTDNEHRVVEALRLVLGNDVERIAMVGGSEPGYGGLGRRAVVKLKNYYRPVSLKSLGDGAARFFGVALALANCRNGFPSDRRGGEWRTLLGAGRLLEIGFQSGQAK